MDESKMDSQKIDELRERRREEALARRMGEALDRMSGQGSTECPDADVVAAYYEKALGQEELARYEGHFAGCARCRKILTVLAASVDTPLAENEVARLGELVASTVPFPSDVSTQKIKPIRPGQWDWRARWLAPALGIAAVLAVWFAMRPPWRASDREPSGTLVAQAPKVEIPPNPPEVMEQSSKATAPRDQQSSTPAPSNRSNANRPLPVPPENAPVEHRVDSGNATGTVSSNTDVAKDALQKENKSESSSDADPALGGVPSPLPSGATTEAEAQQVMAAPQNGRDTNVPTRAVPSNKATPAPQRLAGPMIAPQASAGFATNEKNNRSFSALKSSPVSPILIMAPSGSTIWRAGIRGSIEHSTDAGQSYVGQASPLREDWLAGVAISDKVGWLAGREGAIAKTIDGEHWERIAPPSQLIDSTAKLPDWIGITARDAQNATITAQDGRHFATQDGGKTWQIQ